MHPAMEGLRAIVGRLHQAGVPVALGGSGLLYSLELVQQVRDWDLTTDAPLSVVKQALSGLPWKEIPAGEPPYATQFRLAIPVEDTEIDLLGGFAFQTEAGICRIPTVVLNQWQGIPMGSPTVWLVAYRLMGRHQKADLLAGYLKEHGARPYAIARLLQEPLPEPVRDELLSLIDQN